MYVNADRSSQQIADIGNAATVDATLLPALIKLINQYPRSTRAAIVALATALGTVNQN
jgi:hypothetical protein